MKTLKSLKEEYKKSYNEAADMVGKVILDKAIDLVKSYAGKTYYFIGNVMLFKPSMSKTVTIEVVSDEYRNSFDWNRWYRMPYAKELGMTPKDKNLFIC